MSVCRHGSGVLAQPDNWSSRLLHHSVQATAGKVAAVTPSDIAYLLAWAAALGGYQLPAGQPSVAIRPPAFFQSTAQDCGYYDKGVLYLKEGLAAEDAESCAVHELSHWLQEKSGRTYSTCEEKKAREDEAYLIQRKFVWLAQRREILPLPFLVAKC